MITPIKMWLEVTNIFGGESMDNKEKAELGYFIIPK